MLHKEAKKRLDNPFCAPHLQPISRTMSSSHHVSTQPVFILCNEVSVEPYSLRAQFPIANRVLGARHMQAGSRKVQRSYSHARKMMNPKRTGNEASVTQTLPGLARFLSIWLLISILS